MRRVLTMMLCLALAAPGCATTIAQQRRDPAVRGRAYSVDPMLMADYIRQLPIGSRVKITNSDGKVVRATLMSHDKDPIVVQRRTRIPEAPVEIRVADIVAMELDVPSGNVGRNIAIGAAAAAGATLTVLLVLAAIFSD